MSIGFPVATGDLVTAAWLNELGHVLWDSVDAGASFPAASVTSGTLNGNFKHLAVVLRGRTDVTANTTAIGVRLNSDSSTNYLYEYVSAIGSTLTGGDGGGLVSSALVGVLPAASAGTNFHGQMVAQIGDYAATDFAKVITAHSVAPWNTSANSIESRAGVGFWGNTSAVTSITVVPTSGNFVSGTRLTIYGWA